MTSPLLVLSEAVCGCFTNKRDEMVMLNSPQSLASGSAAI
jgi:hypothetical protein